MRAGGWLLLLCVAMLPLLCHAQAPGKSQDGNARVKKENTELGAIKKLQQLDDSASSFDFFESQKDAGEDDYEKSLLKALKILDKTQSEQEENTAENGKTSSTKGTTEEKSLKDLFKEHDLDYDDFFDDEQFDEHFWEQEYPESDP